MSSVRGLVRDWLPPVLARWIRQLRGLHIRFEGHYADWEEARSRCRGYENEEILSKVLAATLKVKRGDAVYERDSVLFERIHYSWPVLSGLMWAAARDAGRLDVLDFGGALGSSYFQNLTFLSALQQPAWSVLEQAHYVAAGREHIQDQRLRFYATVEECLAERRPNVILLSSVLQYLPRPFETLGRLTEIGAGTLILDTTTYSKARSGGFTRIRIVPESIYRASYPCHFFDEEQLRRFLSDRGYVLVETFDSPIDLEPDGYWSGHIFTRKNDEQPGSAAGASLSS